MIEQLIKRLTADQWSIIASLLTITSLLAGIVFGYIKLFKKDKSQSNVASIKDVKGSKIAVNQQNRSE